MERRKKPGWAVHVEWHCRSWKNGWYSAFGFNWLITSNARKCLVVVVVAVDGVEVVEEGSAVQAIYHQWDLHLLIYKIWRERLLLCIPCVIGQPFSTQYTDTCGYTVIACPSIHRFFEWREAYSWAPVRIRRTDEKITILYCWKNKIFRQSPNLLCFFWCSSFSFQNLSDILINIGLLWCRSLRLNAKLFTHLSFLQKSLKIISIQNERKKAGSHLKFYLLLLIKISVKSLGSWPSSG